MLDTLAFSLLYQTLAKWRGNTIILPASKLPYYSVHAVGGQLNYIHPATNLVLFFKYEHEYKSDSHTLGNTIVFGGNWTLKIPKS